MVQAGQTLHNFFFMMGGLVHLAQRSLHRHSSKRHSGAGKVNNPRFESKDSGGMQVTISIIAAQDNLA